MAKDDKVEAAIKGGKGAPSVSKGNKVPEALWRWREEDGVLKMRLDCVGRVWQDAIQDVSNMSLAHHSSKKLYPATLVPGKRDPSYAAKSAPRTDQEYQDASPRMSPEHIRLHYNDRFYGEEWKYMIYRRPGEASGMRKIRAAFHIHHRPGSASPLVPPCAI